MTAERHRRALLVASLGAGLLLVSACQPSSPPGASPRFSVEPVIMKAGPRLMRFDTATGDAWVAPLIGARSWKLVGADTSQPPPGGDPVSGRFEFTPIRTDATPLVVIKVDTTTGDVWRLSLPEDRRWVLYEDDY